MKIRGAVLEEIGRARPYAKSMPIEVQELDLDPPGPGEILVRIEAAGICHSDLSVVDGNRVRPVPMLLGHESAGIVEELGEGVDDVKVGDRVVMCFLPRCEECANCRTNGRLPCTPGSVANNEGVLVGGRRQGHPPGDHVRRRGLSTGSQLGGMNPPGRGLLPCDRPPTRKDDRDTRSDQTRDRRRRAARNFAPGAHLGP